MRVSLETRFWTQLAAEYGHWLNDGLRDRSVTRPELRAFFHLVPAQQGSESAGYGAALFLLFFSRAWFRAFAPVQMAFVHDECWFRAFFVC